MTDFELNCYGMTEAEIREEYMNSLTARIGGLEMVIMGLLSDAQELMSCNTAQTQNQARQYMNIAKFLLTEMMAAKETA